MSRSDDPRWRRLTIEALTVLAADASDQLAWVGDDEVLTDDIAFDFDFATRAAEGLVAEGDVDPGILPDLQAIDLVLGGMNARDSAVPWADALVTDPGWDSIRSLARQVLRVMSDDEPKPLAKIRRLR
ncbi:hypothetical protein ACWDTR_03270 [Streptomyces sp. NPDC003470]|uniref:hypothetical protein n=1 Tax=Streptomyces sp. NPDC127100 TaxID=3347138 RepID=UPI0036647461